MKKFLPLFLFIAIVIVFFRGIFLHGLLPIPSDTLVGLYHPFRDALAQNFPRGVPFKNFLITDPIRQQYPWRELAISLEKQFQLPLWNPYSFSGYPLLANFQTGALYPFNILFFFLPFPTAWTILIILQPLMAGTFLYLYLKNLKLHPHAAILGSIAFAFSGFAVAWLEWGVIMQTCMWLPLLLLVIDKIFVQQKNKATWYFVYFLGLICSFFAGHVQIFFYVFVVSHLYLLARWWQKGKHMEDIMLGFPFAIGAFFIAVPQLFSTIQFIFLSARSIDQSYLEPGWFIPWQHLVQFIFPDFFGNPTTLNYWGIWNYGELIGYIGMLPLLFAIFSVLFRRDKKTLFWTILCLCAFLFALPTPIAWLPYMLHIPFLSTSQPTRLLGVIDLSLAVLAAFGLDLFIKKQTKAMLTILGGFLLLIGGIWVFSMKFYGILGVPLQDISIAKHNMVFSTTIFASIFVILVLYILFQKYLPKKVYVIIFSALIFIIVVDLLRFGDKFTPFTQQSYLYPPTKTISFLQNHIGNYRFMTTDSQILPPNVSDIYRLQSIEGYDPLYIERYGAYVASLQRNKPDISTPFGFNRIITPHDYTNPLINLLGVKYILTFSPIASKGYIKVSQEGETLVYENKNVLPRAFFVKVVFSATGKTDAIEKVYANSGNLQQTAVAEGLTSSLDMQVGFIKILSYTPNAIRLHVSNTASGFLVLTDIYYPTWHAYIDGKETKIYITDFTFRGIEVPAGMHTVVFQDHLL